MNHVLRWEGRTASGFTLVELLVSIAIIGILLATMLPVLGRVLVNAKNGSLKVNARVVQSIVMGYGMDHNGNLPTSRLQVYSSPTYQKLKNPFIADQSGLSTWGNALGASPDDNPDKHAPITIWNTDPQPVTNDDMLGSVLYVPYKTVAEAQNDTTAVSAGGDAGSAGYEYYTIQAMSQSDLDSGWSAPLAGSRMTNW